MYYIFFACLLLTSECLVSAEFKSEDHIDTHNHLSQQVWEDIRFLGNKLVCCNETPNSHNSSAWDLESASCPDISLDMHTVSDETNNFNNEILHNQSKNSLNKTKHFSINSYASIETQTSEMIQPAPKKSRLEIIGLLAYKALDLCEFSFSALTLYYLPATLYDSSNNASIVGLASTFLMISATISAIKEMKPIIPLLMKTSFCNQTEMTTNGTNDQKITLTCCDQAPRLLHVLSGLLATNKFVSAIFALYFFNHYSEKNRVSQISFFTSGACSGAKEIFIRTYELGKLCHSVIKDPQNVSRKFSLY